MIDRLPFTGRVVTIKRGKAACPVLRVPGDVLVALRTTGARHPRPAVTSGRCRGLLCRIGTAKTRGTRDEHNAQLMGRIGGEA